MTELITINTKGIVPNHLNDTNIFCRYGTNTIIDVEPKEAHFAGYKLNEKNVQEIKFTNISDEILRFHIIPPVSKYFQLKYKKPERMVPGFHVKCTIIFTPDKPRNYNDFIKIHTKDSNNNIIIPIYAYPAIKGLDIPRNLIFPCTPLGRKCEKKLMLHSDSDLDFDYEIVIVKDHPAITIDPLSGVIPARGDKSITLQFCPTDYVTCEKIINVYISQYNFKPIVCTLTGISEPGYERKTLTEHTNVEETNVENSDLISISKLELRRKVLKTDPNLAVATHSKENQANAITNSKVIKKQLQMEFESRVRENVLNEKQNQLRWQTCRGAQPITEQEIEIVKQKREINMKEYNLRMRRPSELAECYRDEKISNKDWTKTIRYDLDDENFDYAVPTPQFVPECWMVRKAAFDRFRCAVWKTIINARLQVRLKKLIESGGNFYEIDNSHLYPGGENLTFNRPLRGIPEERLPKMQLTFDNNFEMTEYKLMFPLEPEYPYLDLIVPLEMKVLNYERIDTSSLSYQMLKPEFKMNPTVTLETTIAIDQEEPVSPILYCVKPPILSVEDKDNTLIPFLHSCSYYDNYSYFPLYYYKNQLLEDHDAINMEWKLPKSPYLMCKKLVKPKSEDCLVEKALESSFFLEQGGQTMTKNDLTKLDYIDNTNGPVINSNMMYAEFPILITIKEKLDKKLNQ